MTTSQVKEILGLARAGLYDHEISERLRIKPRAVSYCREKYGVRRKRGPQQRTMYTLYDRDGSYLFEGNVGACAKFLGVRNKTVMEYMSRFRAGMNTKIRVYKVEGE